MKRLFPLALCLLMLSSCVQMPSPMGSIAEGFASRGTVTRWTMNTEEDVSRFIPVERHSDVFADFAWTTPNVKSVRVVDSFVFNGHSYAFSVSGEKLSLTVAGKTSEFILKKSQGTYYYDVSRLKYESVSRQRWVPKTEFVTEHVSVQRTRQVPRTSIDSKGHASTSYHTEFYTDWEFRTRPVTKWVWETYYERVVKFPKVAYFDVVTDAKDHFLLYQSAEDDAVSYYLQNPEYYMATEKNKALFGVKDINLLFIDADSDGAYMTSQDKMLFNVWNPYSKESRYRSISLIMDNYWYQMNYIGDNYFMDFALRDDGVAVNYANEQYIDGKATGRVTIAGLPSELKAKVRINGKNYAIKSDKPKKSEYGKYRMVISVPGHLDFEELYLIDAEHPQKTINYQLTSPAGKILITNVYSPHFKVMIENTVYSNVFFSPKAINVPYGTYAITINVEGFQLVKEITVGDGPAVTIDFEKELKAMKP